MTKSMLPRLLVLLTLLANAFPASGAVFKSDKNLKIPAEETIKDDLYAVGETITIDGIVEGDLIAFAKDIDNYKLLSWPAAVALGFFLPWLEIASGVALVTRWLERGGVLILGSLTNLFIAASIVAKARGLDISCGCFGHISKDWSFGRHLAVDFAILGALAFVWWRSPTLPVMPERVEEKSVAAVEP